MPTVDRLTRDLLEGRPSAEVEADGGHVVPTTSTDQLLLVTASRVLTQLRVIRRLCTSPSHHGRLVAGIFDLATSYATCPAGSVGAVATLVERVRDGNEEDIARSLVAIRSCFSRDELVAGAVALSAATTSYVADLLGVDPIEVHDEIVEVVPLTTLELPPVRQRCRHRRDHD